MSEREPFAAFSPVQIMKTRNQVYRRSKVRADYREVRVKVKAGGGWGIGRD